MSSNLEYCQKLVHFNLYLHLKSLVDSEKSLEIKRILIGVRKLNRIETRAEMAAEIEGENNRSKSNN